MKFKKIFSIILSSIVLFSLSGCGNKAQDYEDVPFGDIDTSKDYKEESILTPSLVDRKEEIDIHDYFIRIPIEITQDVVDGKLPDLYDGKHNINRIQLNGVYFDINEIAINKNYKMGISDGIFQITIPQGEGNTPIVTSVAQIASGETDEMTYEEIMEYTDIIYEYQELYNNDEHKYTDEYGDYYTYNKYVDWMNNHENSKKNIVMYSPNQVKQFVLETLNLTEYNIDDFSINSSMNQFEYSEWYDIPFFMQYEGEDGLMIDISVKKNTDGVFLIMTSYPYGANINVDDNVYFSPTMIINIAQDNYYEIGETFQSYVEKDNYRRGVIE